MSLKFSATTHSFRIGGWTNSDGNTALSSWNVFFFVKKSNDSKSNQNALAPLPIDGTIADSSMRFFCSSFFFFFCFVLKGNTIPRHATTQSRALGLTVRAAGIVRMFTPRSFALVSFFFLLFCFVCVTAVSNRCYAQPQRLHEPGLSGRHGTAKLHLIDDEREFAFFFAMFVRCSIEMRVFFMNERSSVRWDSTGRLVAV